MVGYSGGALTGLQPEQLFRAVNAVRPSTIRIEADESTYGLHIVLRFELERALIAGELDVADLPEAWNARMREYLGVEVRSRRRGGHAGRALVGGTDRLLPHVCDREPDRRPAVGARAAELTDLDEQLAAGELQGLREWLRENVHRHGSRYSDTELLDAAWSAGRWRWRRSSTI